MMTKQISITTNDEYFDLVPRPNAEQRKALVESIKKDGLLNPIIINKHGVILDGYTRYEICQELGVKPKFEVKNFLDKQKERQYVITSNLRRRHLNDFQILELLEKELIMISEQAKKDWYDGSHIGRGHKKPGLLKSNMKRSERSVYREIGSELGINPIRIEKFMYIKRFGNEQQVNECRTTGQLTKIIKELETQRGTRTREEFYKNKIKDEYSPFKTCPVCGTMTLEVYVGIKEKYCSGCDYYYTLKRRKH